MTTWDSRVVFFYGQWRDIAGARVQMSEYKCLSTNARDTNTPACKSTGLGGEHFLSNVSWPCSVGSDRSGYLWKKCLLFLDEMIACAGALYWVRSAVMPKGRCLGRVGAGLETRLKIHDAIYM